MALQVCIKKKLGRFLLDTKFEIEDQRLGILGASGCGKSMTLKCIAGIETPDEGYIIHNGEVLFDSAKRINVSPQKRQIGYLFQNYALFPTMTVEQNICIGMRGDKKQIAVTLDQYLERFQLTALRQLYPAQLSGGQQQRVALARMMAVQPRILLLDEPFSALDSYLKEALLREMLTMLREFSGHILMVSHNRDEMYKLCSNLAIMDKGTILAIGKTTAVFENPQTVQAARLTGCKNISAVRRTATDEVEALNWGIHLKTAQPVSDQVTHIGIRAHHIMPSDGHGHVNEFPISIESSQEAPFERHYFIRNKESLPKEALWWKVNKYLINEAEMEPLPSYVSIRPEDIMLLYGDDR